MEVTRPISSWSSISSDKESSDSHGVLAGDTLESCSIAIGDGGGVTLEISETLDSASLNDAMMNADGLVEAGR